MIFPHLPSVQLNISPFESDYLTIFTSDKDDTGTVILDLAFGFIELTVTLDEPPLAYCINGLLITIYYTAIIFLSAYII